MLQDKIKELEDALRGLSGVDPKKKARLLGLIESIKSESALISKTHAEISKIAGPVRAFEGAHPKLVEIVDELCLLLSRLGI